jgi:hypothetical protein
LSPDRRAHCHTFLQLFWLISNLQLTIAPTTLTQLLLTATSLSCPLTHPAPRLKRNTTNPFLATLVKMPKEVKARKAKSKVEGKRKKGKGVQTISLQPVKL